MIEVIYHWSACISLIEGDEEVRIDADNELLLRNTMHTLWDHTICLIWKWYNQDFSWFDKKIDVAFMAVWWEFAMDTTHIVDTITLIQPKWAVPIYYEYSSDILNRFAMKVMQHWVAVPKVLKPEQMIVLD